VEISRQNDGGLRLHGDLHISNVEELHSALLRERAAGPALVLDLSDVQSCDAASLQLLCSLQKSAQADGVELRISASSPAIQDAAAILGLTMDDLTQIAISPQGEP